MGSLQHGPAPWRREDHNGVGYKIVDATGEAVCFHPYPQSLEHHANARLLLKSPELLERLKGLTSLVRLSMLFKGAAEKYLPLVAAERLVEDIESMAVPPPPKPPEKESL